MLESFTAWSISDVGDRDKGCCQLGCCQLRGPQGHSKFIEILPLSWDISLSVWCLCPAVPTAEQNPWLCRCLRQYLFFLPCRKVCDHLSTAPAGWGNVSFPQGTSTQSLLFLRCKTICEWREINKMGAVYYVS